MDQVFAMTRSSGEKNLLKNQEKFQQIHNFQGMLQVQKLRYDYDSYIACKNH